MSEKTNEEIKNCPFCSGKAKLHTFIYSSDYNTYKVKCGDCEAESVTKDCDAYVIEQWNNRTDSAELDAARRQRGELIEALEYYADKERWTYADDRAVSDLLFCPDNRHEDGFERAKQAIERAEQSK